MFKQFDYIGGRTFVVGDIHGELDLLLKHLDDVNFDYQNDKLYSVGDLVDRGPSSYEVACLVTRPWFRAVRGNHEQMCIDAGGTSWHVSNGGDWFNHLTNQQRQTLINNFKNLPLAIQFTSPSDRKIGVVHAAFPATKQDGNMFITDWADMDNACQQGQGFDGLEVLWDRWQIGRAKKHFPRLHKVGQNALREFNVANIDHVYLGHTPLKEPMTLGNMTWLDTGAFATGKLTMVEVD